MRARSGTRDQACGHRPLVGQECIRVKWLELHAGAVKSTV